MIKYAEQKKKILNFLKEKDGLNMRQISKQTEINYASTNNILRELLSNGIIEIEEKIINGHANKIVRLQKGVI